MNLDRWITRSASRARAQVVGPNILLLRSHPQSVSDARLFIRGCLATNVPDASEDHLDQVSLVVSELVTNAVTHGSAPGGPLRLVVNNVCAGRWGANDTDTGESVWAEVHAT
ncbi:ATP-binding protein [Streptomyces sp. NPDC050560]|uniref:ATP-binding protein n=1 Tax=Streptomyces sp. NPDC050560 TaxID=3365630 RepID=UPI0037BBB338